MTQPLTPEQCWQRATVQAGGHDQADAMRARYHDLLCENGHLVPGCTLTGAPAYTIKDEGLCGEDWSYG